MPSKSWTGVKSATKPFEDIKQVMIQMKWKIKTDKQKNERKQKFKNEKGAIIVEATISLPIFMFTIITILSVVNICIAQSKMGTFINESAKELSKYSYLCTTTGLAAKHADVSGKGSDAKEAVTTILSQDTGMDFITKAAEFGTNLAGDAELRTSFLNFLGDAAISGAEAKATEIIVEKMAKTRFTNGAMSGEDYMSFLKIKNLKFEGTKFMPSGTDDIQIVADYDVQVIRLLGIDIKFHFTQCAKTKAWGKI